MEIRDALTSDDVLLEPGPSEVLPADVDTKTRLTRMTPFVHEQARLVAQGQLVMLSERHYAPRSAAACRQIGLAGGAYSGLSR